MSDQDDDNKVAGGVVAFAVAVALLAAGGGAILAVQSQKPTTVATQAVAAEKLASASRFSLALENNKLTLEGAVADEATKTSLLKKAALLFGLDNVIDKITVDAHAKALGWKSHALDLLAALKRWGGGRIEFDVDSLRVATKTASADAQTQIIGWLRGLFADQVKLDGVFEVDAAGSANAGANVLLSESIEFASGSFEIAANDQTRLDAIAEVLKDMGRAVVVAGHTDNTGEAAANLQLSQDRATAVKAYLQGRGVDAKLLTAKGLGQEQPVASNDSDEGRQRNRRIEFVTP